MKPMKKQAPKSKTEKGSNSTIKSYFKTAPNGIANGPSVCVKLPDNEHKGADSKAVYVQALKDRLKSYNGEIEIEKEKEDVTTEFAEEEGTVGVKCGTNDKNSHESIGCAAALDGKNRNRPCDEACVPRKKYDDLKKTHMQLCLQHCELSMKYNALLKIATHTVTSSSNDVATSSSNDVHTSSSFDFPALDVSPPTDKIFTANQLIILNSLPLDKKQDSTFIHHCIDYAYTDNKAVLVNKTLKGTRERIEIQDGVVVAVRPSKGSMTPEKSKRIEALFVERVTKSKCLAGEFAERIKATNINRLIASAIRNLSNKEQPKGKLTQQNENLEL